MHLPATRSADLRIIVSEIEEIECGKKFTPSLLLFIHFLNFCILKFRLNAQKFATRSPIRISHWCVIFFYHCYWSILLFILLLLFIVGVLLYYLLFYFYLLYYLLFYFYLLLKRIQSGEFRRKFRSSQAATTTPYILCSWLWNV